MDFQSESWVILEDAEYNKVWDRVYKEFCFQPDTDPKTIPFSFNIPVDVYDITQSQCAIQEKTNEVFCSIFIECMKNDEYMYALDWQHTGYRYNPRIKILKANPSFIIDERFSGGGYNAYFPEFLPDGDYYFFIAKDFSWGYLTHPWQKRVWVYGNNLMKCIKQHAEILGFKPL